MHQKIIPIILFCTALLACNSGDEESQKAVQSPDMEYAKYSPNAGDKIISRAEYADKLYGFWLGQCIANWTGLVTEMDKIGNIGEIKTGDFYTREDWGKPDQASIWANGEPSTISKTIDFVFRDENEIWGADDDTDLEYMYQYLLLSNKTSMLTGEQIREGWLKHMKHEEENFLWVANQRALDKMLEGVVPPATSDPEITKDKTYDNYYEMIDAQLTTEIFGLFSPARPDIALKIAEMPIRTTARENAQWISEFYVILYSLASEVDESLSRKEQIFWMAEQASKHLPENAYAAKMYDFVKGLYAQGLTWEQARDAVYVRYQVEQQDGYTITSKNLPCNGCFVGGINFAASLVSLFYGEGDLKETIKIGALCGWDSDNPTATWGGLLGFMYGKSGVEEAFGRTFSDKFNIHRTRVNFPNEGLDYFANMAENGLFVVDRVVQEQMQGGVDLKKNVWYIPQK
ncbi:ADP-ribosylglycohydrolase family protein [Marinilongibacter aquaticus]|uniref:ADP-ribosylglycohydrolase family protein n=1 Tax=Marinilongibacter aquaticus TaxID=2975157 RepID=UPI0021BD1AC6|nr:ADP-ribosylglycohydrolase family protein [Marinilongibacter aquaticus]UBM59785.1 ADP-ribosylglycohydrolase family protein [Marinilongibacter aquaticus]